ncbi:MAG TPA: nitrate- and nitrite sensing domain-containing protein, partial [Actinomycetes bacterium]
MLGNLSLRPKIALILLLPVAALLLLAGLRIGSSVSTSRQAAQVRGQTEFALRGTALAHELERERGLTLGGLLADRPGSGLRELRAATSRARAAYRDSAADLDSGALAPATAEKLASARSRLEGLTDLRRDVNRGAIAPAAVLDAYNTTIADLLNTNRGLASGIADPQLAQKVGAFVAVSRIKELAALERELISEVLDRGRFAPGQFRRFTSTLATRAVLLSEFRAAATDEQRAVFVDTLVGPE